MSELRQFAKWYFSLLRPMEVLTDRLIFDVAKLQAGKLKKSLERAVLPGTLQQQLSWRDESRLELWRELLQLEREYQRKVLPTLEERHKLQMDLWMPFLGEQPKEEWLSRLKGLVWTELELDDGYKALQWYAAQLHPELEAGNPTEGLGFGSQGLLFESLQVDPDFGSPEKWRGEYIQEKRELDIQVTPDLVADLDFLVTREWELEKAYQELLDCGQQQRPEELDLMDFSWEQEDDQREPPMPASQPREEGKIAYTTLSQEMEKTGAALSSPAEHTGEEEKSPLLLCFGSAVLQPVGEGVGEFLEKELLSVEQENGQQGLTPGPLTNPLETQVLSWGLLHMSPVTEGAGWEGVMPTAVPWEEREMPTAVPWGDELCRFTSPPGHPKMGTVDSGGMGATLPHALRRTQDWRIVGACLSSHTGPPWTERGIQQTGG